MVLSGCSSVPKTSVEVVPTHRPVLQQSLLEVCPDLPLLENRTYTQGEALDVLSEWIVLYKQCQFKQKELARFAIENSK